ncbi:VOC family protein [Streptomyces sp. PA5.6]|uniref:VOC family protein n=1 Tax=Streptomyces sp. PA5.6 TaxID=3035651 RepID=UPI003904C0E4
MEIKAFIIDAVDPEPVAAFWSALLDWPVAGRTGPYIWLRRENGTVLGIQRVDERKTVKNRMHLDLAASDFAAEQRRVEELGGRRLEGYDDGGFLVMADPEGNEFCIIPDAPFDLDDEGRTNYQG